MAVSNEEIVAQRDQARDDIKHATSTLSESIRAVGIGLSLLIYTLALEEDKTGLMADYAWWIALASLCGILCLVADGLQYFFLWRQKLRLLTYMRTTLDAGAPLTVHGIETADRSWLFSMRQSAFYAKGAFAVVGCAVVVLVLFLKLTAPQTPPKTTDAGTPQPAPSDLVHA